MGEIARYDSKICFRDIHIYSNNIETSGRLQLFLVALINDNSYAKVGVPVYSFLLFIIIITHQVLVLHWSFSCLPNWLTQ